MGTEINIAGDCVFNFKEGGKTNKPYKFDNIIAKCKNKEKKEELENKLKYCRAMHHSPYNFSLMPRTGGMNNSKKCDRPDWLIRALTDLYEQKKIYEGVNNLSDTEKKELQKRISKYKVINYNKYGNELYLFDFLMKIGSVEAYVNIFYHLDTNNDIDKKLLDAMLEFGDEKIKSVEDLDAYMDLAIAYWSIQRLKYLEKNDLAKIKGSISKCIDNVNSRIKEKQEEKLNHAEIQNIKTKS